MWSGNGKNEHDLVQSLQGFSGRSINSTMHYHKVSESEEVTPFLSKLNRDLSPQESYLSYLLGSAIQKTKHETHASSNASLVFNQKQPGTSDIFPKTKSRSNLLMRTVPLTLKKTDTDTELVHSNSFSMFSATSMRSLLSIIQ